MSKTLRFSVQMALATLISRVLGLVRDALFAEQFGTSPEYDAYVVAILLPFFLRRIFAEGALTSAFVPIYNKRCLESLDHGNRFSNTIITFFLPILLGLVILSIYFMPSLVALIAPGLDAGSTALTVYLARIVFPFILFIAIASVYTGILNSHDQYFAPAISPAIHNIFIIVGIFFSPYFDPPILAPTAFFLFGGVAQLLVVVFSSRKTRFRFEISFDKKEWKSFYPVFMVSFVTFSITQINSLVDTNVVSRLGQGTVSLLQYANRLYQLPLGVLAISVSTVALSQLSRGRMEDFASKLSEHLDKMLFFVLPSTILLMMMRMDIVRLIYQRGAFGVYDTWITSEVLMGYLWGLPFYSLYALLSRAEYARIDGKKIAFFATAIMVITNVVLDLTLGLRIGPYGVALATSIAGMAGCTVLIVDLVRNGFLRVSRVDLLSMGKIGLAGLGIGLVLLGTSYWDYSFLNVFIRIFIGGLSYLGILLCLRHHDSVRLVRKIIRR